MKNMINNKIIKNENLIVGAGLVPALANVPALADGMGAMHMHIHRRGGPMCPPKNGDGYGVDLMAGRAPTRGARTLNPNKIIDLQRVGKSYKVGSRRVWVLKKINLIINEGEMAIIFGPSGCGKSTLLHLILGMEDPSHGRVHLMEKWLATMTEDERAAHRWSNVGIVFQQSNWIKSLLVWENVAYPLMLTNLGQKELKDKAILALKMVGLEDMANKKPMDLSGGEQQRISLARALVINPKMIVADEPTGNLDSKNGKKLINLLLKLNKKEGKTILMVTHDESFLKLASRRIFMKDGMIEKEEYDK